MFLSLKNGCEASRLCRSLLEDAVELSGSSHGDHFLCILMLVSWKTKCFLLRPNKKRALTTDDIYDMNFTNDNTTPKINACLVIRCLVIRFRHWQFKQHDFS